MRSDLRRVPVSNKTSVGVQPMRLLDKLPFWFFVAGGIGILIYDFYMTTKGVMPWED